MTQGNTTGFGWIHSFEDYLNIFSLSKNDLKQKIIVFPAGISNFNAQLHQQNPNILSADELYQMSPMDIDQYVAERLQRLTEKFDDLDINGDKETLYQHAQSTAENFKNDFPKGKLNGRYQAMQLPELPLKDESFDIALCPRCPLQHRNKNHSKAFEIINELCRIAQDVRVFINVADEDSFKQSLGPLLIDLQQQSDAFITINDIDIRTENSHSAMLRVKQRTCSVTNN